VREHGDVAAGDLRRGGAHSLGDEAFHVGMDGAVVAGDDVPARLRSPGGSSDYRVEQRGIRNALGRPYELLFLLGQIARETVDAFGAQPDSAVRDLDVGEDIGLREVRLLCLRCLVGVRSERGDVDQPRNAIVGSGAGDDASAVGVTDENRGAADPPKRAFNGGDVVHDGVEPVLGGDHNVTFCLKCGNHLAEARAVRPELYRVYEWHDGSPEGPLIFRDHRLSPLEEGIRNIALLRRYEEPPAFPFADFEGSFLLVPIAGYGAHASLERPVIHLHESRDVYFYSVPLMLDTAIDWIREGVLAPGGEHVPDERKELEIWRRHNPGVFDPKSGLTID